MMSVLHRVLAPLSALALYAWLSGQGVSHAKSYTAAITLWTAWWWMTESLPIAVTSLIPFVFLPIGGVIDHKDAAGALGDHVIILLMGAFMLAKGIERSGVHERIALAIVSKTGGNSGARIVMAFMLASALLSMWISNTATVLALLPVAMAVVVRTDDVRFHRALILGLAYASSVGGVGTLIGTPPNVIFSSVFETFTGNEFGFQRWMTIGVPVVVLGIPLMALWLTRGVQLTAPLCLPAVGAWRSAEKRTLSIFLLVALLWVTRSEPFGGWSGWLGLTHVGDSSIALFGVLLLFIFRDNEQKALLDWTTAVSIPWGVLLLFAGGICLAKGFVASGLSESIGSALSTLTTLPLFWQMLLIALSVSFLTEVTSNTATATLLMPILASAAISANQPPEWLMIPAVISCSCAFCLPVATAPNSIVFSTERFTIKEMAREGTVLNILMAVIVATVCYIVLA